MASTNYKKTYISLSFLLPMLEHIPFAHCIESKQKCTKVLFKWEFHLARLMNAYILFCLWDRDKILLYFIQRNCHTGGYCHTKCTWYYTYTDSNLIKIRSLSCFPRMWLVIEFPQISHATTYITKREQVRDLIFSNSCSIFTLLNPCGKKSIINVWITLFSVTDWSITQLCLNPWVR